MPLYAFSLFTPSQSHHTSVARFLIWCAAIVQGLGNSFSNRNIANLVSVPIYVTACIVTIVVGIVA